jgi:hypothetical protein
LKKVYSGPKDARGESIFPGYVPGGELGPYGWAAAMMPPTVDDAWQYRLGCHFFADMVYEDPKWEYRTFDVDRDVGIAKEKTAATLNAIEPNLKKLAARGSKLILYQGWDDPAIPPLNIIKYYNNVLAVTGTGSEDMIQLYMVPGMQHCARGPGASEFGQPGTSELGQDKLKYDPEDNIFSTLERWVQTSVKPGKIVARQREDGTNAVLMTRPICAYPQLPHYKGTGDTKDSANFDCR